MWASSEFSDDFVGSKLVAFLQAKLKIPQRINSVFAVPLELLMSICNGDCLPSGGPYAHPPTMLIKKVCLIKFLCQKVIKTSYMEHHELIFEKMI